MFRIRSVFLFTVALVAGILFASGCATDSVGYDTANVSDCTGAYRDAYGYCRLPNGRFTFSACCEASCEFDADAVLEQQGIEDIDSAFPEVEVCEQESSFENDVTFEEALDAAIESFVNDDDDIESPLGLMDLVDPTDDPVCPTGSNSDRVKCYLNRSTSLLAITYSDGERHDDVYPAENRESIEDNWVFYLHIPEFSDHLYWAVVPRFRNGDGAVVASNYGFN